MRVGPHVNNLPAWGQGLIRFKAYVDRVRPPMVKFIDTGFNDDAIAYAVARDCQVVGRIVFDDGDQPIDNDAKRRIAHIVESARKHPLVTWWEFYNEAYEKGDEMAKYADRSIEFMQAMEAIGKKGLIGGFSTGTPDESQWQRFRSAVEYAWRKGHGICLHQYSAPDMRYMAGLNQWNNGNPRLDDPVLDPKAEGWHTLRHRKALKVFQTWGVSARFFIGESGNDDIQQRPGGPGKGWKDWRSSSLKLGDFADQLHWLGWQYSHDPSVIGWVDYGWGSTDGGDERWKHFDLSSDSTMLDRVMALQLELPRLHFGAPVQPPAPTPPAPTPPPPTPPEQPPMNNVEAIIWAEVDKAHKLRGLPYTPSHALVAAAKIPAGVMLPTTDEIPVTSAGGRYVAQRFQRSDTGAVIVLYCRDGQWNKVYRIAPESGGGGADVPPAAGPAFAWPIGSTAAARALPSIPPGWYVSVPFDQEYTVNGRAAVHPGLDISDVRGGDTDLGAPVYSMADGVVTFSGYSAESWGNIVMVRHDDVPGYGTLWTQYAHLQARAVMVEQKVTRGQVLGTVGKGAGDRFSAHLHYEIRREDLPATYWPSGGGRSMAAAHAIVRRAYVDPIKLLGA